MTSVQNRSGNTLFHDEVRTAVKRRLQTLTAHSEPRWGAMTAKQMICHLSDSYRLPLGQRPSRPFGNALHRSLFKWAALYTAAPWPKGATTAPEMAQDGAGTPPTDFARDLAELLRLVDAFATAEIDMDGRTHPLFGPLTSREWGVWGYRHAEHHLRQFGV